MKRPASRFSLVFSVAVAAYFVYFLFIPDGAPPEQLEGRASSSFTESDQPKQRPPVLRDNRNRDRGLARPDRAMNRVAGTRPGQTAPHQPTVSKRTKAPQSTTRSAAAKSNSFLGGSNIHTTASKGNSPRAKVAPALAQLLASYEATHDVKAEIRVIIQSNPDSYEAHGAPTGLAQPKALEQVHAHAGRMTVREIRQLVEQGQANYITLDMPLRATNSPQTVADDFDSGTDYAGNDGSANWSNNWQEAGESNGPDNGLLQVVNDSYCASGSCMYLGDYNESSGGPWTLTRRADLSNSTSATLSYHYGYEARSNEGFLKVQVRGGGGSWTTLTTYVIERDVDVSGGNASYNISSHLASDTEVRFLLTRTDPLNSSSNEIEGYFYIDNVQIQLNGGSSSSSVSAGSNALLATIGLEQPNSGNGSQNNIGYNGQGIGVAVFDSGVSDHTDLPGFSNGGVVRDEFNDRNYNNSNGSLPWNGPWVEIDEPSGSGVDDGPVQVSPNSTNCLSPKCLRVGGSKRNNPDPGFGVSRAVDLSSGSGATLSFSYRRGTYDECESPYADLTLDISSDSGANWSTLKTYAMDGVDSNHTFESFDISEYTSAGTQLRFLTHGPNNDCVFFADNIQIELGGALPRWSSRRGPRWWPPATTTATAMART